MNRNKRRVYKPLKKDTVDNMDTKFNRYQREREKTHAKMLSTFYLRTLQND